MSEAETAKPLLVTLGVAEARLILETKSRDTHENAAFTRDLVKPKPGEIWILVTSASHMPRAVGAFRKAGWTVLPYPVDYRYLGEGDEGFGENLARRTTCPRRRGVPGATSAPRAMSAARRRTPAPTETAEPARIRAPSEVASSMATTASAPSGSTPPVAIDTAAPGGSGGGSSPAETANAHGQLALRVRRPQREAVERGVVPAGQVDEGMMGLREHAPEGVADGHVLRVQARTRRAEPVARFVKPE